MPTALTPGTAKRRGQHDRASSGDSPGPMSEHPGRPPSDLRDRILSAAGRLFGERGYDGTSMRDIAKEVGISGPALYWHFRSKEDIFFSFLDSVLREFVKSVEATVTGRSPDQRMRQFVEAHVRAQLEQLDRTGAYAKLYGNAQLRNSLPADRNSELEELERAYLEMCKDILREGSKLGQFEFRELTPTAFAIINLCEYVITWFRSGGRLGVEEISEIYADLVLRMLRPGADQSRAPSPASRARPASPRVRRVESGESRATRRPRGAKLGGPAASGEGR